MKRQFRTTCLLENELYGEYAQDHKPVIEQSEAVGRAVHAPYNVCRHGRLSYAHG